MLRGDDAPMRVRWARLRFQIIGHLLASPPEPGELSARLVELAERSYRHPATGEAIRFGASTIERWYYLASRNPKDPLGALSRRVHANGPIAKAIGYVRNQRDALSRFLEDGRLRLDNNVSERELRRQALGRNNWLSVGSDDGAQWNATFVSLIASCQLVLPALCAASRAGLMTKASFRPF